MRNLASIQKILELSPIKDADAIEVATVLGWKVVVKKGEFKIGDLCVYIEIDSILPPRPEFEFLAAHKYRIKTVRLRGQISQGICFPLSILNGLSYPNDTRENPKYDFSEGANVTDLLRVTKYEPPMPAQLNGKVRGLFPTFILKTDEIRLQALPAILERHKDKKFFTTEKIDGSSVTYFIKDGEFHACSRNLDLILEENNSLWKGAKELELEDKLQLANANYENGEERFAIQGEIVGEGIQGNKLKLKGQHVYFFNVYDFIKGEYLSFGDFINFCQLFKLPTVPILDKEIMLLPDVEQMVVFATRKSVINSEVFAEGIVWRPLIETKDEDLGRLSFKVINPEFLLKHGE